MNRKIAIIVATWFGSGLVHPIFFRGMAGTYGSLAALPLAYAVSSQTYLYLSIIPLLFLLGLWSIPIAENELGPRMDWRGKIKRRDQNQIVIDEVLGMMVACIPLLWIDNNHLKIMLNAFWLFRLFDIAKITPIGYFDRMKNPIGVMLDDVVAGIYSAYIITIVYKFM